MVLHGKCEERGERSRVVPIVVGIHESERKYSPFIFVDQNTMETTALLKHGAIVN